MDDADVMDIDYRKLRAIVYAVVPGKQNHKNIGSLMDNAVRAYCRVARALHRRGFGL